MSLGFADVVNDLAWLKAPPVRCRTEQTFSLLHDIKTSSLTLGAVIDVYSAGFIALWCRGRRMWQYHTLKLKFRKDVYICRSGGLLEHIRKQQIIWSGGQAPNLLHRSFGVHSQVCTPSSPCTLKSGHPQVRTTLRQRRTLKKEAFFCSRFGIECQSFWNSIPKLNASL